MTPLRMKAPLVLLVAICTLLPRSARAQIYPPAPGVPLPESYLETLRRNPRAYRFENAWFRETERVRENRRRIEAGIAPLNASQAQTLVSGTRYVPVLLGKFLNTPADPYPAANLQTELFNGPWGTGTLTDYYDEISYGNIDVTGTVYNWKQVSQNDTYYEGNPGCNGLSASCGAKVGAFLKEVLDLNDGAIDFGLYDNDGPDGLPDSGDDDGYVDFIAFVHPEKGAECGGVGNDNIWSHRWVYSAWTATSGGLPYTTNDARTGGGFIKVQDYTIQPALACGAGMIEIGVFCHEFGHAFGLPDLYDTNSGNGTSQGIGNWCLMAAGSYGGDGAHSMTPAHMSAWCKEQLGWISPTVVCEDQAGVNVPRVEDSPFALKIFPHGLESQEYFLVENRQKTLFDTWLYTGGLAIWHVDNNMPGNADETHKLVDLEEADGLAEMDLNLNRGNAGDLHPGSTVNRTFNDASNPNSKDYTNAFTGVGVTNISNSAATMTADVALEDCKLYAADFIVDEDCADHDHLPDPGETFHLSVGLGNLGAPETGVAATLSSPTAGVTVLDASASFGTVPTGIGYGQDTYRISLSGGLAVGAELTFDLNITGDGGYASTDQFKLFVGGNVLLVDDDEGLAYHTYYQTPITASGRTYVHWETLVRGTPRLGNLKNSLAVVWEAGDAYANSFGLSEQRAVKDYLAGGGRMFVTGQDIGYDLVDDGSSSDASFYRSHMHADFILDDSNDTGLLGVPGDPISDGLNLTISGGDGANNQAFPSIIGLRAGATAIWKYDGTNVAALRWSNGHKMVYLGFGFEAISTQANRNLVMDRILDWLVPADLTAPSITLLGPNGGSFPACSSVPITWTASDGSGVSAVDLLLSTDCGATYPDTIVAGLANTGSYAWTAPATPGTEYRVKAVAKDPGDLRGCDESDACFSLTVTPPAITVVAPDGGETLVEGTPYSFEWSVAATCPGGCDSVEVEVSRDGGTTWPEVHWQTLPGESTLVLALAGPPTDSLLARMTCHSTLGNTSDDSDGHASLVDLTPPMVEVVSPNGGELWELAAVETVKVDLFESGLDSVRVSISHDGGGSWTHAATALSPGLSEDIPVSATAPLTATALVRAEAFDPSANASADTSDSLFSIVDTTPPVVAVLSPDGGEVDSVGASGDVFFSITDAGAMESTGVYLSRDAGGTWAPLTEVAGWLSSPYSWTVTGPPSDSCLVRVLARDGSGNSASDESDSLFAIADIVTAVLDGLFEGRKAPVLLQNYPNPMNPTTTLRYFLPRRADVAIRVYSVTGRSVATLVHAARDAGVHEVAWDGRDDRGNAVASGVYLLSLEVAGRSDVRKVTVVR